MDLGPTKLSFFLCLLLHTKSISNRSQQDFEEAANERQMNAWLKRDYRVDFVCEKERDRVKLKERVKERERKRKKE